jgi:hypothetical protein
MERGFIIDEGYGKRTVPRWVLGEPEVSMWMGGGLKLRGKDKVDVKTYRCKRCGYLESYA